MNVCEEARQSQENNRTYGKADNWVPLHLEEGDKLYQLDMGPIYDSDGNRIINSGCFIDEDTYNQYWDPESNTFDIRQYCQDAQIAPYYDGTYKCHISEYEVGEGGLDVAYGTCENNTAFGEGGCPQIYVSEQTRDQLEKTNYQITPEISDQDRYIGEKKAHDMVEKSYDENWKLAEYEKENMRGIADEAGSESQNNNDTMKTLSNEADEIKENNPNNANESLKNTADQENLPTTGQSNTQGNEQTQNEDNSMNVQ